jgi:hypothetical protein
MTLLKGTFCQDSLALERHKNEEDRACPLGSDTLRQLQSFMELVHAKVAELQSAVEAQTTLALAGYPLDKDGKPDTSGHRSYHEALIEQAKNRTDFWRKMTFELTKYGLIGFAVWAAIQLWAAFVKGPVK